MYRVQKRGTIWETLEPAVRSRVDSALHGHTGKDIAECREFFQFDLDPKPALDVPLDDPCRVYHRVGLPIRNFQTLSEHRYTHTDQCNPNS
jgi:hypothetical protein